MPLSTGASLLSSLGGATFVRLSATVAAVGVRLALRDDSFVRAAHVSDDWRLAIALPCTESCAAGVGGLSIVQIVRAYDRLLTLQTCRSSVGWFVCLFVLVAAGCESLPARRDLSSILLASPTRAPVRL